MPDSLAERFASCMEPAVREGLRQAYRKYTKPSDDEVAQEILDALELQLEREKGRRP